ncbi:hypothetical protein [Frankia sp. R82]|uniref:hypothetical protein n=1 Tax=Frankia sp. R82 TaxID=2950553 RepID=UPI0020436A49|nr:hypothetical protein [Frankia sp. R82]MCM3882627.1 hypothetical protein [Frankia sp. R82]
MVDKEAIFDAIAETLGRRHQLSDLNPAAGTFDLHGEGRSVRVTLTLNLLERYFDELTEKNVIALFYTQRDARDEARLEHIIMQIEESFESDMSLSLVELRLERSIKGKICLAERRGPNRRSFPPAGLDLEGISWTADRPDS